LLEPQAGDGLDSRRNWLDQAGPERGDPVDVRLLGIVEVCADGIVPVLGGPKQRAVLADLALHAGQIVPTVQLIDDLWGEQPPSSAKSTLKAISRGCVRFWARLARMARCW
jgi:hypothetical protein